MEEFLQELGITNYLKKGHSLVVDISDDNEGDKIKSKLDKSHAVSLDEESSLITFESASLKYEGEIFHITLLADFEQEIYRLTIYEY